MKKILIILLLIKIFLLIDITIYNNLGKKLDYDNINYWYLEIFIHIILIILYLLVIFYKFQFSTSLKKINLLKLIIITLIEFIALYLIEGYPIIKMIPFKFILMVEVFLYYFKLNSHKNTSEVSD